MPYLAGVILGLFIPIFGTLVGFERRGFYSVMLIVVASYYALFACIAGDTHVLLLECGFIGLFVVASVLGFKKSLWLVAAGLVAHGVFDFFHHHIITNSGVLQWWPMWCLTYDVVAGAYLAWLILRSKTKTP